MAKRPISSRATGKQAPPAKHDRKNPIEPEQEEVETPSAPSSAPKELTAAAVAVHAAQHASKALEAGAVVRTEDDFNAIVASEKIDSLRIRADALKPTWVVSDVNMKALSLLAPPGLLVPASKISPDEVLVSEELFSSKGEVLAVIKQAMREAKAPSKLSSREVADVTSLDLLPLANPFGMSWAMLAAFLLRFNSLRCLFTISTSAGGKALMTERGERAIELAPVRKQTGPLASVLAVLHEQGKGGVVSVLQEVNFGDNCPRVRATSFASLQLGLTENLEVADPVVSIARRGGSTAAGGGKSTFGSGQSKISLGSLATQASAVPVPTGAVGSADTPLEYHPHFTSGVVTAPVTNVGAEELDAEARDLMNMFEAPLTLNADTNALTLSWDGLELVEKLASVSLYTSPGSLLPSSYRLSEKQHNVCLKAAKGVARGIDTGKITGLVRMRKTLSGLFDEVTVAPAAFQALKELSLLADVVAPIGFGAYLAGVYAQNRMNSVDTANKGTFLREALAAYQAAPAPKGQDLGTMGADFLSFIGRDIVTAVEGLGALLIPLLSHRGKIQQVNEGKKGDSPLTATVSISLTDANRRTRQQKEVTLRSHWCSWQQLSEESMVLPSGREGHVLAGASASPAGYRNGALVGCLISWMIQGAPMGPISADVLTAAMPSEELLKLAQAKAAWTRLTAAVTGLAFAGQRSNLATTIGLDAPRNERDTMRRLIINGMTKGLTRVKDQGMSLEKALLSSFSATRAATAANAVDLQAVRAGKLEKVHDTMGQLLMTEVGGLEFGILAAESGAATETVKAVVALLPKIITGSLLSRGPPVEPLKHVMDAVIKSMQRDGGFVQFGAKLPLFISTEARRPGTEADVSTEVARQLQIFLDTLITTLFGEGVLSAATLGVDFAKHTLHDVMLNLKALAFAPHHLQGSRGHSLATQLPAVAALHQNASKHGLLKETTGKLFADKCELGALDFALNEITTVLGDGVQDALRDVANPALPSGAHAEALFRTAYGPQVEPVGKLSEDEKEPTPPASPRTPEEDDLLGDVEELPSKEEHASESEGRLNAAHMITKKPDTSREHDTARGSTTTPTTTTQGRKGPLRDDLDSADADRRTGDTQQYTTTTRSTPRSRTNPRKPQDDKKGKRVKKGVKKTVTEGLQGIKHDKGPHKGDDGEPRRIQMGLADYIK